MKSLISNYIHHKSNIFKVLGIILTIILPAVGCSSKYGRLQLDAEVQTAFETNQVPANYRYHYYGDSEPYVIFGVEPRYEMNTRMWRDVSPDTEEFKNMTRFLWEDYGYYKFGANILDPRGEKVGIMFTAIRETTVKFVGNKQIVVMPNTPFLWGPEAGVGGGNRIR
jgi:hypothetical protein